jgi:hypothetical protein
VVVARQAGIDIDLQATGAGERGACCCLLSKLKSFKVIQ